MMASESPLDPPGTPKALLISKVGFVFNIIFTVEMFLKITAYGLLSYLSEGWNLLDVTVVTTAWAPLLIPGVGNYSAIRAVRVLRALRTVKRIPSLKRIIETLLRAIPEVRACAWVHTGSARKRAPQSAAQLQGGSVAQEGATAAARACQLSPRAFRQQR